MTRDATSYVECTARERLQALLDAGTFHEWPVSYTHLTLPTILLV